jgi:hypothetical protein
MTPTRDQVIRWATPERWAKLFAQIKSEKPKGIVCQASPYCWVWQGRVNDGGYAEVSFTLDAKEYNVRLHTLMYVYHWGDVKEGTQIRHGMCGNRRCSNPQHLIAGTPVDNANDPASYRGKRRVKGVPYKKALQRLRDRTPVAEPEVLEPAEGDIEL